MTESTLRQWMQQLGPRLINLSAGICRDRHRAEEIVQEAFIKLWNQPPDGGEAVYPAWLRRVVTNLSINALQRTKHASTLPEFSLDPAMRSDSRPDEQIDLDDQVNRVRRAMDRLDDAKRTILILRGYEQLSYEHIAEAMGVPVGTVMSRLNRARTALLQQMKKDLHGGEDEPAAYDIRQYKQA